MSEPGRDRSLFSQPLIERLVGVVDGALVPIENGSAARWARDSTGRNWVRKRESDTGVEPLLAEAIAFLLGEALGVRQPVGAVFHDGSEWSWMSEAVVGAGEHWDRDQRDLIANPDDVGRMLLLDVLTVNEDRHARNLLLQPVQDDAHLRVWAIDSGNALIGWPTDFAARGLEAPDPYNHARGLPIETLIDSARAAAGVAEEFGEARVRAWVWEAAEIAREPERDVLATALFARCQNADEVLTRYLEALGDLQ